MVRMQDIFRRRFLGPPPPGVGEAILRRWGPKPYDAEVLYLQSTGTQFIRTGVNPVAAPKVVAEFAFVDGSDTDYWGNSAQGVDASSIYIADFSASALAYYRYGSSSSVWVPYTGQTNLRQVWSVGKEVRVDGDLKYTSPNEYVHDPNQGDILVFRSGRGNPAKFRLYSLKIYDGDELVRDFVPVRFTNGDGVSEGALYDRANPDGGPLGNGMYVNAGTGAFLFGRDSGDMSGSDVEWIQSSGTQFIDTEINPVVAPTVVADFEFVNDNDTDYWGNANSGVDASSIYIADFRSGALMYYRYGSNTYQGVPFTTSGRHVWSVGKEVRVDGDLKYTSPNEYVHDPNQGSILVFRSRRGNPAYFKLYSLKIYDGDELVRDFIPIRAVDIVSGMDVGALRDRVSGRIFDNMGTGSFIVGPDVNSP